MQVTGYKPQVTGQVTDHGPQVTGQITGQRWSKVRSQVTHKNNRALRNCSGLTFYYTKIK